jgi:Mlc titration factor MtfA (ptsG expression regulator)
MFFTWLKNQRRKKILAERFPTDWLHWLERNTRYYQHLDDAKKPLVQQMVQVFVAEKAWFGGSDLPLTDEMKVTVSAQVALLVLGQKEPYYFDHVQSIILHASTFSQPAALQQGRLIVDEDQALLGEAWHRGPILLAWDDVLRSGRGKGHGGNVVLHEFAHHLDGLDGDMDGTPPLVGRERQRTWYQVTETEYERLVDQMQRHEVSLLDQYGATNRAEFFAVATECFFERPHAMRHEYADLYGVLRDFYLQDPAEWLPDAKGR